MIIENTLDNKSFGPFASSTGLFLFIGGVIFSYFSLFGLIIAIIGAFVAFTSTRTIIDTESKRIKHADYLFGLLPLGRWIEIQYGMKLGIKAVKRGYSGYTRGSQQIDIQSRDVRIFLLDSNNKQILPIKKFKSFESAREELKELEFLLGITTTI
jgi:hypothetical protein